MTHLMGLRAARQQQNPPLTQEQLAERSGVDQTYISLIERGLRVPSTDIQKKLAEALSLDPSVLGFEPLPDSSVDKSYDREGQSAVPTALGESPNLAIGGEV